MAIDERSRHELYLRLEESLGADAANTMMEHLPPVGWADVATKRDLDALAAATKRDIDALAAATKRDIDALATSTKKDLEILKGEMHAEFTAQTRAMFLAIVTIVLTMSGLTLGVTFAALSH